WLGGGNAGSNGTHTGKWTGLCNNLAGGWNCTTSLPGAIDGTHAQWTLSYTKVPPGISPGSAVDITGGVYAGVPGSFFWPSEGVTYGLVTADTVDTTDTYVVPGGIQI